MKADISSNYIPVILGLNEVKEQQVSLAENTFMPPKSAKVNFYPPVLAESTRKPFLSLFNCDKLKNLGTLCKRPLYDTV